MRPGWARRQTKLEEGMNRSTKGALIALSVAALFTARGAVAAEEGAKKEAKVHCTGVNECAGKGSCKSANNSCAGKNACKGKGVMMMSAEDCVKKGGTVTGEGK
jgi:hypothetical protein